MFNQNNKENEKQFFCVSALFYWLLVFLLVVLEDKDWSGGLKNSDLVFQTYLPTEGAKGTELSIRGNNFGEDISQVQVWVNEKEAEVISVTSTRIMARVAEASGSGVVKVRVGEVVYSYPDLFSYGYIRNVYTVAGNGQGTTVDGAYLQASCPMAYCDGL